MAKIITIPEDAVGQRIDNFLITALKGVPRSRIYRGLRKGEFRVNGGRISADYRLCLNDQIRIPPIRVSESAQSDKAPSRLLSLLESRILYEDEALLAINKPSGIPVHGGTNVSWGLIELLRELKPQPRPLELIHRLDRKTSGCLLIAKKRKALLEWHELLTKRQVNKRYLLLVEGCWDPQKKKVELPLKKNVLQSGERIVRVDSEGKSAITHFKILKIFTNATLLSAELVTGRTHQIRVHAAASGCPVAGDKKYGDNKLKINRLFLHCEHMGRRCKTDSGFQSVSAELDIDLKKILESLKPKNCS